MFTNTNLATIIKEYRKNAQLTQKEFADKSGISLRSLVTLEKSESVSMDTALKVLNAAECDLHISRRF